MLILFLAAYLVFFAYSRGNIYAVLHYRMRVDFWESVYVEDYQTKLRYPSADTNKLYEDFLYYSLPVVGDWYWWRNIGLPRLGI